MFAWPLTSMAPWSARRPGSSLDVCDLFCYNPAWFQYLYLTSFLILHGICHMLNATSDFFDMMTYLHLFSRKVAIRNSWNKIDIFMFIFLCFPHAMQFWRSFPRRKETQYMSKKDRESFCCVPLQKPGQVWTLSNVCHWEKVTLVKAATHPTCVCLTLCRGGDLPLDLQWVPSFPAYRSPALGLPKNWELLHLQSGSSGCRKLFLLCFQSNDWQKCLLQVHPTHPLTPWWRLVNSGCAAT